MITPSFGLTATERVLPRLALDFTTASLDSRITFTRSLNTATRVNSSGYIETVNADVARFDYDPVTLVCKGLLIEEARTNLIPYSSEYDQTGWSAPAGGLTITPDVVVSPDGTQNAYEVEKTATGDSPLRNTQTIANDSATYSVSVYLKKGTADYASLYVAIYGGSTVVVGTVLRWSDLALTNGSAKLTAVGNSWYRLSFQISNNSSGNTNLELNLRCSGGDGFGTGSELGSNYIWGAQVEAGAFPTSYIPTTTTSLTRNADVATMTGTNFSDWFNASEGAFYAEYQRIVASKSGSSLYAVGVSDNTSNNIIGLGNNFGGSNDRFVVLASGALSANISVGTATTDFVTKVGGYKINSFQLAKDGVLGVEATSGNVPTVDRMGIGCYISGSAAQEHLNGTIKSIYYWPQRLLNSELQAFSK